MTTIEKITYRKSNHFALPRLVRVILSDGRDLTITHVKLARVEWLTRFLGWNDSQVDAAGASLGAVNTPCAPDAGYSDHQWEFQAKPLKEAVLADPVTATFAANVQALKNCIPPARPTRERYTPKQWDAHMANRDEDTDEVADGLEPRP